MVKSGGLGGVITSYSIHYTKLYDKQNFERSLLEGFARSDAQASRPAKQAVTWRMGDSGDGIDETTMKQLRRAAEFNDAEAQYRLGIMYRAGRGVAQDVPQGAFWLHKAAEQGQVEAQYQLGCLFREGTGVARDEMQAAAWFRKAAENGHADAQYALASLYQNPNSPLHEAAQALQWFQRAAEQRHALARITSYNVCYTKLLRCEHSRTSVQLLLLIRPKEGLFD